MWNEPPVSLLKMLFFPVPVYVSVRASFLGKLEIVAEKTPLSDSAQMCFLGKLWIQDITSVLMPGEKVFFLITALQVTVETHGPGKHGCGRFTSIGPSPIGPEAPTPLWITADLNKYHPQGRRQKARNNLNCQLCQADQRLIVPVSA